MEVSREISLVNERLDRGAERFEVLEERTDRIEAALRRLPLTVAFISAVSAALNALAVIGVLYLLLG